MQTHVKRLTPEEYLELERRAEFRSEYHNGEIIPMTGGMIDHYGICEARSDKFKMYRSIPQFQEYMLIDQYQIEIEHYTKTSEGWLLREYGADAELILLRSFEIEVAIADLYEGVTFEPAS